MTRVCTDVLYLGLGARIRRVRSKRLSNYHLTKKRGQVDRIAMVCARA